MNSWNYKMSMIKIQSLIAVLPKTVQNGWYVPVQAWAGTWTTPVSGSLVQFYKNNKKIKNSGPAPSLTWVVKLIV